MAITAFPYTAVLDVSANSLLGNNTGSPAAAIALTATQVRTLLSVYTSAQVDSLLANYQPLDADLTAIAALTTTSFGRSLLTQADAAAARTTIGAGTSSFSGAYGDLSGIPGTFAPSAHKTSHATGGSDALTAADIGAAATSHTHAASDITSGTIATARLASGTASASTYLRGDQTWATVSAGVSGSTGSVDNAILRADGTGGSTVQASDWLMADNYTASPNNTVNHASLQATGSTTNVSVSIVPKGSGSFSLHVPDGTSTGGNARGANAIDLQTSRTAASQVASATGSVAIGRSNTSSDTNNVAVGFGNTVNGDLGCVGIGDSNTASGRRGCVAIGLSNSATGQNQNIAIGNGNTSNSAQAAITIGRNNSATASNTVAIGNASVASRQGMFAMGNSIFAVDGDNQRVSFLLTNKTTTNAAVTLFLDGSSARLTIASGRILYAMIHILGSKSDGTAVASYMRQVCIKNVGGTTSLVGTVNIFGTDEAAGTSIAITADDTNDALQIAVTGVASETWRWTAAVYGVELVYGA